MAKSVPAIFLDRDGTINVDHGYVHEIDEFEFIEGVIDAMRQLKEMGYALVVVTNQSGIARGKFTFSRTRRFSSPAFFTPLTYTQRVSCPHACTHWLRLIKDTSVERQAAPAPTLKVKLTSAS